MVYALDGVRILDLTQVAVGPYATFLLSSLGAEVIKVESHRRPDTARGPVRPAGAHQMKQYPRGEPGERPWNRGAHYNQRNRGKLGITLDLTAPAGKEIFKRLAARSDAVIENYRATVMERQGLGWDVLRAVNEHLVYVKLSSQGDSGPERDYGSLGSTLEQTTGLASITGYLDRVPLTTGRVYPDPVAGLLAVGALIAGLRQARRRGVGSLVDCSQREMTVGLLGEAMMDYAFNGRVQEPAGNRSASAAPQGVYPCAGDDQWIAIAVESDAQWRSLRELMGDPAWAKDAGLETAAGRRSRHDEIDGALGVWTRGIGHHELMHRLQATGRAGGSRADRARAAPRCAARGARLVGRAGAPGGRRAASLRHAPLAIVGQSVPAEHPGATPGRAQRSRLPGDPGTGRRGVRGAPEGRRDQHRTPLDPGLTPANAPQRAERSRHAFR